MNITSFIYDALFVFIVLLCFIKNWRRGFLSGILKFLGFVIACFGGYVGSRALSETVYQIFIKQRLIKSVTESLRNSASSLDVSVSVQSVIDTLPKFMQGFAAQFFGGKEALTNEMSVWLSNSTEAAAISIVDQVLYPIIYTMLQAIFFILLFFAIMIVVRSFSRVLKGVRHIPLLGPVNSLLGGVLGLLQAVLVMMIIVMVMHIVIGITAGQFEFLNDKVISDTYIFKYFYNWNPIGGISASMGDFGVLTSKLSSITKV